MATTPPCRCWPKARPSPAGFGPTCAMTGRLAVRPRRRRCSTTRATAAASMSRQPRYVCRRCEEAVVVAPAPERPRSAATLPSAEGGCATCEVGGFVDALHPLATSANRPRLRRLRSGQGDALCDPTLARFGVVLVAGRPCGPTRSSPADEVGQRCYWLDMVYRSSGGQAGFHPPQYVAFLTPAVMI